MSPSTHPQRPRRLPARSSVPAGNTGPGPRRGLARPACRPIALAALFALAALVPATPSAQELVGERTDDAAPPADSVEPVGDWIAAREIVWREERIGLHLRTAYTRPMRLPEPVALVEDPELPGCPVLIDGRVVAFEPSAHFDARPVDLVGLESGRRYRFRVRSSAEGKRIPLTIVVR